MFKTKKAKRLTALIAALVLVMGVTAAAFVYAGSKNDCISSGEWTSTLVARVNLKVSPTDFIIYDDGNNESFTLRLVFEAAKAEPDFFARITGISLKGLDYTYIAWATTQTETPLTPVNCTLGVTDGAPKSCTWFADYTFPMAEAGRHELTFNIDILSGINMLNTSSATLSAPITVTVIDRASLTEAIALANEYLEKTDLYTSESLYGLETALIAANTVNEDPSAATDKQISTAVSGIYDAIDGLEFIQADYTELDAVLARVPGNLSSYTDESADALRDVLDSVLYDLPITEQAQVDEMTERVSAALEALVLKEIPTTAEPTTEEPTTEEPTTEEPTTEEPTTEEPTTEEPTTEEPTPNP